MSELQIILYLIACPIGWYLLASLDYGLNGGQLGRHPFLFPFECFAEDIKCYWFGGQKHRVEFIRSRCVGEGSFCGSKRSYTHKEIRESNLYEEVFWAMCGGRISFWSQQILYLFLGPVFIGFLLAGAIIGLIVNTLIFWPIDKLRGNR
ncbi:MAG: hypothetical protein UT29_C0001G0156 [Candidatus Yanofskybacteria bacterium GW2011_GWA1_39_13]|uniref:Uncharacterized protein n=1 Tax=Yanofskybacteria sp. (strain GW2011_GWA1_39_13) TaxID=1619019 RepID=A0A0G0MQF8_YANXG|nr:MAG: hypothetical protein UT29_C0001G0156 [Candidatus Yanofskybacteria bacterium GW2011_GWA1_39_13]